jgi:hypothetical protein|tara:strand:- start:931 stop:1098 length:168 start_codon:yes stop_codon:yes gene_type:complete
MAISIPLLFNWLFFILDMNKRLIVVGIFLGITITIAFFIGCPNLEIGCKAFDIGR